ncbi:MAG: GNAT family N-acetyltransferase [Candidatus Aminicenantia bacterium]
MGWVFFEEEHGKMWDSFVEEEREGRIAHLIGFKNVVEKVYNFKPFYLCFKEGDKILATFSSFIHNSIFSGKRLLSQPFSEYGGLLISESLKKEGKNKIIDELFSILKTSMKKEGIRGVEIRGKVDSIVEKYCQKLTLGEYGIKKLAKDDNIWDSVDYMVRKAVKKAKREGVKILEDNKFERIDDFYRLHLISMKRLGSPPHSKSYFIELKKELSERIKIIFALYNNQVISALLGWKIGKSIHITDNPSNKKFFHLRGNDYLHYELIEWSKNNGFEIFDFGPMKYEGQEFYKRKWNLESFEYSIFHYPKPLSSLTYKPPFYVKFAREIWKHVPLNISKSAGKFLRKELGL